MVGITQQYIPINTIANTYSPHKLNVPGVMVLQGLTHQYYCFMCANIKCTFSYQLTILHYCAFIASESRIIQW